MCGRFVQAQPPAYYADSFSVDEIRTDTLPSSWNVAPTDEVYAVADHRGARRLGTFRWGLIPFWAKDRKIAARNINARMETVAEKPAFRDSFVSRRCIIPADGFYEWEQRPKGKLPHYIFSATGTPLALAGLWASWHDPETEERVRSCTIITGRPNDTVAGLHDRMPAILTPDAWAAWLDPEVDDRDLLLSLLEVYPAADLAQHPVSTLVNKVANNVPECIVALPPIARA